MAEEKTPTEPGGLTKKADTNKERVAEVSNVSRTINQMQKQVDQQLTETKDNVGDSEHIEKVQNSMVKVLSSLSNTVNQIGRGFSKAAVAIPEAGKQAISQYSQAISQDISYNKQNIVAMALSRSTPIFGYFASKFMETDVYKSAAAKMKAHMAAAFGSVTAKFKEGVGGFFKKIKGRSKKEKPIKTIKERAEVIKKKPKSSIKERVEITKETTTSIKDKASKEVAKKKPTSIKDKASKGAAKEVTKETTIKTSKKKAASIPKLAVGGYVEKGGLVKLHAGEIVAPIEKVLKRIDDSIATTKQLAKISQSTQLKTMANMGTYVSGQDKFEKVGLFKGFVRALSEVQNRHTEPANVRMLRAVLSIQDSMGATIGTWPQMWQKMLIEHPTFRQIMFALKGLKSLMGTPIEMVYQIFKERGGYKSHLSRSKNPSQATAENVGILYAGSMWRLDNISKFTRATAEATRDLSSAITGKKYGRLEGIGTGMWSMMGLTRAFTNFSTKMGLKGFGILAEAFTPKEIGNRIRSEANMLAEVLTQDRELYTTKLLDMLPHRKEMKGAYGEGGTVEGTESTTPLLSMFPPGLYKVIEEQKALPVIDQNIAIIFEEQYKRIATKQLEWKKQEKSENKKLMGYTKDIVISGEENLEIQKKMNFRQKMKSVFNVFSGTFGTIKSILSLAVGFIPFLLGGGLKRIMGSLISGAMKSGVKGIFKGIFKKAFFMSITGAIKKGITSIFKKGIFKKGFFTSITGAIKKGISSSFSFTKGIFKKISSSALKIRPMLTSVFSKIVPIFSRILPILSKIAGPIAALASAGVMGYKIGQKLDKMLGISEKIDSTLDKTHKEASLQAKELSDKQRKMLQKALGGKEPSKEGFEAKRQVKMQTLIGRAGEERRKDLGIFGRANMVAIDTAQRKFMNENIGSYLQYSFDDIANQRQKWLKSGGHGGKMGMENSENYGKNREASFLLYLQKNATPLSETEIDKNYEKYKTSWKKKHKIKESMIDEISDVSTKNIDKVNEIKAKVTQQYKTGIIQVQDLKDKIQDKTKDKLHKKIRNAYTNLNLTEREEKLKKVDLRQIKFHKRNAKLDDMDKLIIMGLSAKDTATKLYNDKTELAKNKANETMAQAKQITSEIKKQGQAALDSSKDLTGTVKQGVINTSQSITNSVNNINTVNNSNNQTSPQFSEGTLAVMQGNIM